MGFSDCQQPCSTSRDNVAIHLKHPLGHLISEQAQEFEDCFDPTTVELANPNVFKKVDWSDIYM